MERCSCMECGHIGQPMESNGETLCGNCGSRSLVPCGMGADRPVPMRVLRSAEGQALAWKKRAEALSRVVNKAITNGHLGAPYAGEARRIMAGEA